MNLERVSRNRCFGGYQDVYRHQSQVLGCEMRFGLFLPPAAESQPCSALYFLSGLTCTEQNVLTKAGAQQHCAEHGLFLVCPDTSPRGDAVPDDPEYDLGQGAGFYVNATQPPWSKHYRMYDYVTRELPALVAEHFQLTGRSGIFGHSMGGHGALICALKNPDSYASVSAFSPIVAPCQVPWGHKGFGAYLGAERAAWREYDATELVQGGARCAAILIDQGTDDQFLQEQLKPEIFQAACQAGGQDCELRLQPGYDHSYYFISTFMRDHVAHHARALNA